MILTESVSNANQNSTDRTNSGFHIRPLQNIGAVACKITLACQQVYLDNLPAPARTFTYARRIT